MSNGALQIKEGQAAVYLDLKEKRKYRQVSGTDCHSMEKDAGIREMKITLWKRDRNLMNIGENSNGVQIWR